VATLTGYQFKTVEQKLSAVRSFLRFAAAAGLVNGAGVDAVPAARSARQTRIPSVWDPSEVARIVEAIDRDNPCGKRDYAIVLLITRLGLRGVDVKRLEFGDFDWPGNRLLVSQAKTGHPVRLPLLKDVGWAVIDYLRHGRPDCDCPQVFVRHTAPIGEFSDQDHLHQILVKHARAAHVPVSEKRRHGMHSLRHTLATRLMENGTPVEHTAPVRELPGLRFLVRKSMPFDPEVIGHTVNPSAANSSCRRSATRQHSMIVVPSPKSRSIARRSGRRGRPVRSACAVDGPLRHVHFQGGQAWP
jgi:integrase